MCEQTESPASVFRTWLELFRAPNLLTVPGDPLAGFFLAMGVGVIPVRWERALLPVAASLVWYMMGLLLNDLADRQVDLRERPQRPLPSGRVRPREVATAAGFLLVIGMALVFLAGPLMVGLGLGLVGAIFTYNFLLKNVPGVSALNMGACRGLSLLLGASAVSSLSEWPVRVWIAAGGLTLYIAGLTALARHECDPDRKIAFIRPALIGKLISGLLFLQAGLILAVNRGRAGLAVVIFLAALWLLNRYLNRRFAAS